MNADAINETEQARTTEARNTAQRKRAETKQSERNRFMRKNTELLTTYTGRTYEVDTTVREITDQTKGTYRYLSAADMKTAREASAFLDGAIYAAELLLGIAHYRYNDRHESQADVIAATIARILAEEDQGYRQKTAEAIARKVADLVDHAIIHDPELEEVEEDAEYHDSAASQGYAIGEPHPAI